MTLVIVLNALLIILVLGAIVGLHLWAIVTSRAQEHALEHAGGQAAGHAGSPAGARTRRARRRARSRGQRGALALR